MAAAFASYAQAQAQATAAGLSSQLRQQKAAQPPAAAQSPFVQGNMTEAPKPAQSSPAPPPIPAGTVAAAAAPSPAPKPPSGAPPLPMHRGPAGAGWEGAVSSGSPPPPQR
eukprot:444166-Pelagomonas_calceolata.AAC.1